MISFFDSEENFFCQVNFYLKGPPVREEASPAAANQFFCNLHHHPDNNLGSVR